MLYQSIRETLNSKGQLVPYEDDVEKHVKNKNKDYYVSLYQYTDEHKELFDKNNSVAGIRGQTTDRLYFDLDCADNLQAAQDDAINLVQRLIDKGIDQDYIAVSFSGLKGFSVEVKTDRRFTEEEFKSITNKISEGLEHVDKAVSDCNRIVRIDNTKHQKSGLYKIPLELWELSELTIPQIQELAKHPRKDVTRKGRTTLPPQVLTLAVVTPKKEKKVAIPTEISEIDWNSKPKWLSNCKYAIMQGLFKEGHRNNSLVALAATLRGQGFNKDNIYSVLKSANRLNVQNFNGDSLEKVELWTIANSVTQPTWKGGTFTCRQPGFLQDICNSLGEFKCKHNEGNTVSTDDVYSLFTKYAENFEDNVLYTGIESLDKRMKLLVGTSNALLAPPGVGKTSFSLELLNHNSKQGINSIFFSYDMFHSALYLRMIQKHTGLDQDAVFELFKNDKKKAQEIREMLRNEYKNVKFCFKSGQSIEELENTIIDTQEKIGEKVKLVVVDYNELVSTNLTDSTASSAMVAQKLRQIANEHEVAVLTLLQPSKHFSSPADEITSYNAAKGSSSIAQSMTLMLGCSRPGFDPRGNTDNFFNITCLKNRNGSLFSLDFSWEGLTGTIGELGDEQRVELEQIRQNKEAKKNSDNGWG